VLILLILDVVEFVLESSLLTGSILEQSLEFSHFVAVLSLLLDRFPVGLEVELTGAPALVFNIEPLIPVFLAAEGGELRLTVSDDIVPAVIIILTNEVKVITEVLDVDFEDLSFPVGLLATLLTDSGALAPFAGRELDVGVHPAESGSVVGKMSFNKLNGENSEGHL
jgi:hypothetical protein